MNARHCTPRAWAALIAFALIATSTTASGATVDTNQQPTTREHVSRLLPPSLSRGLLHQPETTRQPEAESAVTSARIRTAATPTTEAQTPRDPSTIRLAETTAQPADRARQIVDQIQQTYDTVNDFQASFTQEYTSASLGETRTSEGRVFFRKPGMMRWDYRTPTQRFLISDGQSLWVYEPEFAQYYEQSLADSQLPTALRFLMGDGNLHEDFDISLRSEEAGRAVLDLVPRRSEGQIRRLRFTVDLDSGTVVETVIVDPLGNTNRLRFRDVRQNAGLPAANFSFSPPAGTTRISAPD